MNTKPCTGMSSHNKRIIILIYTKDCSDTWADQGQDIWRGWGGENHEAKSDDTFLGALGACPPEKF